MTEAQFNRSRFSDVISWKNFQLVQKKVKDSQKIPYPLSVNNYFVRSKGANLLTSLVLFWMKADEVFCYRNNTQGISRKVGNQVKFIPNKGMRGSADIFSMIGGVVTWIEVKYRKDRQSDSQKKFQFEIERSGGRYWLIRTFDEFLTLYKAHAGTMSLSDRKTLTQQKEGIN